NGAMARLKIPVPPATSKTRMSFFKSKLSKIHVKRFSRFNVNDAFAKPFACFLNCSLTIFSCSLPMLLHSFHSTSLHLLVVFYILTKLSIKKYPFCYGQFDY